MSFARLLLVAISLTAGVATFAVANSGGSASTGQMATIPEISNAIDPGAGVQPVETRDRADPTTRDIRCGDGFCSAGETAANCPVDCPGAYGQCGTANTTTATALPTGTDACTIGAQQVTDGLGNDGTYNWYCQGDVGSSPGCYATRVIMPACGAANGSSVATYPTGSNACAQGGQINVDASGADGTYNWQCEGINTPARVDCAATNLSVPPACRTYSGTHPSQPATNDATGCTSGVFSNASDTSTQWRWTCRNTTTNVSTTCSADKPAPANCSPASVFWPSPSNTCGGSAAATSHGYGRTVTNTAAGYDGTATYICNNGAFLYQSGSCNVIAPTVTLSASPTSVAPNGTTTLSWTVSNATACTASNSWTGSKSPSGGSQSLNVGSTTGTRTYTLTCQNGSGGPTTSRSVNVSVATAPTPTPTPPPACSTASISSFTATPNPTNPNSNVTIAWQTSCAAVCDPSGRATWTNTGAITSPLLPNGSRTVQFAANTGTAPVTLTCWPNADRTGTSAQRSVNVTVNPPVNGACGSANGNTYPAYPSSGHCSAGTRVDVDTNGNDGYFNWRCDGTAGGTNAACEARKQESPPACGAAHSTAPYNGTEDSLLNGSNLCASGNKQNGVSTDYEIRWSCNSSTQTVSCRRTRGCIGQPDPEWWFEDGAMRCRDSIDLPATPFGGAEHFREDIWGVRQGRITFQCAKNVTGPLGSVTYGWKQKDGAAFTCNHVTPVCPSQPNPSWGATPSAPRNCQSGQALASQAVNAGFQASHRRQDTTAPWRGEAWFQCVWYAPMTLPAINGHEQLDQHWSWAVATQPAGVLTCDP